LSVLVFEYVLAEAFKIYKGGNKMCEFEDMPICEEIKCKEIPLLQISEQEVRGIVNIFKAFADETRVKMLYALLERHELCVCDISTALNISVASASHHLKALYQMKLIDYEKRGKFVYYWLDDHHVEEVLASAREHQNHTGI
jgi:DNA-binding transcriptional ArsR family regulator